MTRVPVDRELSARLRLLQARDIGPVTLKALAWPGTDDVSGPGLSAARILEAGPSAWKMVPGIGPARMAALERARAAAVTVRMPTGWDLLWFADAPYPPMLRETAAPPPLLWVCGDVAALTAPCVAVVGTRRCSEYGRRMAYRIGLAVARAGGCVVSGLAHGIDAEAHRGALDAGGKTVAVLGCGPGLVYPADHRALQEHIASHGALVSEFMPGEPPTRGHFPRRNRIISGLAGATVVVEAYEQGGALVTAATATEQNRDVYAVPGRADHAAATGSNRLLADGAHVVVSVEDLIRQLQDTGMVPAAPVRATTSTADRPPRPLPEQRILEVLAEGPERGEGLAVKARILPRDLWLSLVRLETDGLVMLLPGGRYALRNGAHAFG